MGAREILRALLMNLHRTVRENDPTRLLHTTFSAVCPLTTLSLYLANSTFCQLSLYLESSAVPLLNFPQDFSFPRKLFSRPDFGDSFVSDVDIIAYDTKTLHFKKIFHLSFRHVHFLTPKQIILSVRMWVHMLQRQLLC